MWRVILGCALLLAGCAAKVQVQPVATPAVALEAPTVAVVAGDKRCRPFAQRLIEALERGSDDGLRVDPRSDLRLVLFSCGIGHELLVKHDNAAPPRARLDGRAHAVVAITDQGRTTAHLLGTSRAAAAADLRGQRGLSALGRSLSSRLVDAVAVDLAQQLQPSAYPITRRVYPRAPDGTARNLHTLAVAAEASGDLDRAYALARAAQRERPNARAARYVQELERRFLSHAGLPPTPDPGPP